MQNITTNSSTYQTQKMHFQFYECTKSPWFFLSPFPQAAILVCCFFEENLMLLIRFFLIITLANFKCQYVGGFYNLQSKIKLINHRTDTETSSRPKAFNLVINMFCFCCCLLSVQKNISNMSQDCHIKKFYCCLGDTS